MDTLLLVIAGVLVGGSISVRLQGAPLWIAALVCAAGVATLAASLVVA
jgi:hypothetical protein